jgi:hypothetical protein
MKRLKSGTLPIYTDWLATATPEQIAFVDSVFAMCEEHYEAGGDTVVECYEPAEVLEHFATLDDAKRLCGRMVEKALDCRWGEDSDPEVKAFERWQQWEQEEGGQP